MSSNVELVKFSGTSFVTEEEFRDQKKQIRDMKEQIRDIKEQLARRYGNVETQRLADGDDSNCSFKAAVADTIDVGIDNATLSLPLPQCHTVDVSLGKELKYFFFLMIIFNDTIIFCYLESISKFI